MLLSAAAAKPPGVVRPPDIRVLLQDIWMDRLGQKRAVLRVYQAKGTRNLGGRMVGGNGLDLR